MKKNKDTRRVNVIDVAKAAGVSVATVSRSFNLPTHVRDEVREKVLAIAAKLGYTPNPAAKALRLQKTNLIGAIIPTLDYALYATMVKCFQEKLAEYGYVVYIMSCGFDSRSVFKEMKLLAERGVEALLVVGDIIDPQFKEYLQSRQLPVVCTYSYIPDREFPFIGFDNYESTRQLTEYLLGLGHRNLAMITGPRTGNDRQEARYKAFVDTIEGYKEKCTYSTYESERGYTVEFGEKTLRRIRLEHPEATAVVCNSDVLAFGVLSACKKLNLKVPGDISVVGHDNMDFASYLEPPLTSLAIPAVEMGIRSAEAIVAHLKNGTPIQPMLLGTQLMIRQSSDSI